MKEAGAQYFCTPYWAVNNLRELKWSSSHLSLPGFPFEKVTQRTLYLQVLDYDRFSRNDPIGEVSIPLNKIDLAHMQTFWKELKPCSDGSVSGSVCFY